MQSLGFEIIQFRIMVKVIMYQIMERQHGFLKFFRGFSRKSAASEIQRSSKLILKKVKTCVEETWL